jgi:hypothetical protein
MTQKLENNLLNGYEVKIGDYISRGFEIFQKNMGGYIGFTLLYFVIAIVLAFIPFGSFIVGPMILFGFHLVSNHISQKQSIPDFGMFFKGFDYAGKIIVITLITTLAVLAFLIPLIIAIVSSIISNAGSSPSAEEVLRIIVSGPLPFLIIAILGMIYISTCWCFSTLIAVFHNKEAWASMEISRKLINKNWFMVFLLLIVIGFIAMSGIFLLGLGLIFTIPLAQCCIYAAFEDIAGLPTDDDIDNEIITNIGLKE